MERCNVATFFQKELVGFDFLFQSNKLTLKMEEREHTRQELVKLEKVRSFLLSENIIDNDSFVEYMNTL